MRNIPQLKDIIINEVDEGNRLKVMTSYFTLYAFKEIKNELLKLEGVDIIINPNKYDSSNKIIETIEENNLKINWRSLKLPWNFIVHNAMR